MLHLMYSVISTENISKVGHEKIKTLHSFIRNGLFYMHIGNLRISFVCCFYCTFEFIYIFMSYLNILKLYNLSRIY